MPIFYAFLHLGRERPVTLSQLLVNTAGNSPSLCALINPLVRVYLPHPRHSRPIGTNPFLKSPVIKKAHSTSIIFTPILTYSQTF